MGAKEEQNAETKCLMVLLEHAAVQWSDYMEQEQEPRPWAAKWATRSADALIEDMYPQRKTQLFTW